MLLHKSPLLCHECCKQHFVDRITSSNFAVSWQLRSLELTPMYFGFRNFQESWCTHQIQLICQNWNMPLNLKLYRFLSRFDVQHYCQNSYACNKLLSAKMGMLITANLNKCFFSFLRCHCSFTTIFFASVLRWQFSSYMNRSNVI